MGQPVYSLTDDERPKGDGKKQILRRNNGKGFLFLN